MPQSVRVEPGPNPDTIIEAGQMEVAEVAVLHELAPGQAGPIPGEPVLRGDEEWVFLTTLRAARVEDGDDSAAKNKVRKLRPGEKVTLYME